MSLLHVINKNILMGYFNVFLCEFSELCVIFYPYSGTQFALTTFQMLFLYMWLVLTILDIGGNLLQV
jgi:ABC-type transport system involved in Fe-S cluster assembly fused permease/ATPase subunit